MIFSAFFRAAASVFSAGVVELDELRGQLNQFLVPRGEVGRLLTSLLACGDLLCRLSDCHRLPFRWKPNGQREYSTPLRAGWTAFGEKERTSLRSGWPWAGLSTGGQPGPDASTQSNAPWITKNMLSTAHSHVQNRIKDLMAKS